MAGYRLSKHLINLSNWAVVEVFLLSVVTWEGHSNLSLSSIPIAHYLNQIRLWHGWYWNGMTGCIFWSWDYCNFFRSWMFEKFWSMGSLPKQEDLLLHACLLTDSLSLPFSYFSSHFFRYNSYGSSSYSSPRPYAGVSAPTTPTTRYGTTLSPPQETKSDRFVN